MKKSIIKFVSVATAAAIITGGLIAYDIIIAKAALSKTPTKANTQALHDLQAESKMNHAMNQMAVSRQYVQDKVNETLEAVDALLEQGNYDEAITLLDAAFAKYGDPHLTVMKNNILLAQEEMRIAEENQSAEDSVSESSSDLLPTE